MRLEGNTTHRQQQNVILLVTLMFVIIIPAIIPYVRADNTNPGVFSIDSKPYGISYAEWTGRWWQWALSIPKDTNPAADNTGKNCAVNQNGPVWFLAGTFGGADVRSCTIPAGKAVLFSPINSECSYAEFPNLKTEADLRACAKTQEDHVTSMQVTVDGVTMKDLDKYRLQSPLISFIFPKNNVVGVPAGQTQGISDGRWVFLQPLAPGKHEIHFTGASQDVTTTGIQNFADEATYHLTVNP
jgi:hypothetical protein